MNFLPEFKKYLFSLPAQTGLPATPESNDGRRDRKPLSRVTAKNYLSDIGKFIRWLSLRATHPGIFNPNEVTPQLVELYKKESSQKFSPASLERHVSSLRKFFNFLKLEGYISESPLKIENFKLKIENDPYRLKDFKNYLYVYNASRLTIKNYLMDIKKFTAWLEQVTNTKDAWDLKETALLSKIDNYLIEEYKRRLLASLSLPPSLGEAGGRSGPYSPRTINRKLSSLRKYLKWASDEGLIRQGVTVGQGVWQRADFRSVVSEGKETRKSSTDGRIVRPAGPRNAYSKFPPFRLVQKTARGIIFIPEFILINPLASLVSSIELLIWKLRGRPVFKHKIQDTRYKIRNLPKEIYAPFAISTTHLPFHRKLLFHLAHTRPKWYKKYHSHPLSHYLHLAVLIVFMSIIGFGIYQNVFTKSQNQAVLGFANPQIPPRILSFQGRLTDSSDNPIKSSTNLRFALYDSSTGTGSALLWQEVDTVAPDSDGIFSLLLGNRSTMSQSLFAERAGLWLGVTVGQTPELTPRQRLATVAYAENADNLQGLPPITQSGAGTTNVVLALDSSGNLTIGGTATPTFQATGGQFTLSGNPLLLTTTTSSNTDVKNVKIAPGGWSFIDLQKPLQNSTNNNNVSTARGAVEFDDLVAILATSSGQSAFTINQNSTGPILSASSSGTARFTISNAGDITSAGGATLGDATADDIAVNGRFTTSLVPKTTANVDLGSTSLRWNNVWAQTINTTGTNTSGQASFTYDPATTAISESSVFINPTTANTDEALLGVAIAGAEKARIDFEGDLILGYNSATATLASDPFNIYNHGTTRVAAINTSGNLTLAAGQGIDTLAAGTLGIGNTTATTVNIGNTAATTLALGAGGALTRTINIGTGTGADTINIGTGGTTADTIAIGGLSTTALNTTGAFAHTGTLTVSSTINSNTFSSTALTFAGASPTISASTTNTSLTINANGTGDIVFLGSGTGKVGIGASGPSAELQVNPSSTTTIGQIIKAQASQTADLLQIRSSLDAVLAKVDSLGNLTANTLTSTVAQGTAPLTVTSTTVVANLNAAAAQQPNPNLVLNSDFSRRNKWMTFMPEVFSDTSGWTLTDGSSIGTVASNILTAGSTTGWGVSAGISTWRDVRMSAQMKLTDNTGSKTYALGRRVDSTNYIRAELVGSTINAFRILKNVAGTAAVVTTTPFSPTLNNWYWLEIEFQGTTVIAKLYSSGASPVAKSSATLQATVTGTVSDSAVATGSAWILTDATTALQVGGVSTGDGGVYVEGWGPELSTVVHAGTLGGQAIGFDESTDAGPIGTQYSLTVYIPATSREIDVWWNNSLTSVPIRVSPSTTYAVSLYEKTSGASGSNLMQGYFYSRTLAGGADANTILADASETSWTRKTGTLATGSTARIGAVALYFNLGRNVTGTSWVDLLQMEQGSITTPWRNAPADDGPIRAKLVWTATADTTITTSSTPADVDARDLAINFFAPTDGVIHAEALFGSLYNTVSNSLNGFDITIDGTAINSGSRGGVEFNTQNTSATTTLPIARELNVSAGKHRVAVQARTNTGELHQNQAAARTEMLVSFTRGKYDLAEEYTVQDQSIEAGDVVRLAKPSLASKGETFQPQPTESHLGGVTNTTIEKTDKGYDSSILGIISTAPAITLGAKAYIDSYTPSPNLRPVALSGRVPVKVTSENGAIKRGDILTSSNTKPGYAMKAVKAGRSIGIAMEDFNPSSEGNTTNNYQSQISNNSIPTGKIMTFVNLSFYDPDVYLTDAGNLVISRISNTTNNLTPPCKQTIDSSSFGLVSTCPKEPTPAEQAAQDLKNGAYIIKDSLGNSIERIQVAASIIVGNLKAGVIESQEIISPIARIDKVQTDIITPLSSEKLVIKLESHLRGVISTNSATPRLEIQNASGSAVASIDETGNASFSGQLSSRGLNTEEATISGTLRTKSLIADNIDQAVSSIRNQVSSISGILNTNYMLHDTVNIASYSAQLANVDTLNAVVGSFSGGLFAVGPTSLSDATVFGQLSIGTTLTLAENSINVLGADLQIQPLKQGGVSFLAGKVYIDTSGNLNVSGNATVKGTLFAGLISPIPGSDLVIRLAPSDQRLASSSGRFVVQNASGSAVLSVNNKGDLVSKGEGTFSKINIGGLISPALAISANEIIATGSAGIATISAHFKELTIKNKVVTDKSLIYITPVGTPSDKIPFLIRQKPGESFTVGTQDIIDISMPFNWLIIN